TALRSEKLAPARRGRLAAHSSSSSPSAIRRPGAVRSAVCLAESKSPGYPAPPPTSAWPRDSKSSACRRSAAAAFIPSASPGTNACRRRLPEQSLASPAGPFCVVQIYPVAILSTGHMLHPRLIVEVPLDGCSDARLKRLRRPPAQLALDLGAVYSVASIVSG